MGGLWSGLKRVLGFRKRTRVLLLGLDGAGKSTVLNCLVGRRGPTAPTVGFEVQAVNVGKVEFIVWVSCCRETPAPARLRFCGPALAL
jgi:ADP-ribosylation factor-like protein 1